MTLAALLIATILAVPLVLGLRASSWIVSIPGRVVVDILRGVPPIGWLFLLFYGISVEGFRLSPVAAGVIARGLLGSAYLAEIFRGALKSIPARQWGAVEAVGFNRGTTWREVIAPQAWRTALPGFTTYAIALLKDSSIVSTVGAAEIVFVTGQEARTADLGIFVYLIAAGVYIAISVPLGILSRTLDIKLRKAVSR